MRTTGSCDLGTETHVLPVLRSCCIKEIMEFESTINEMKTSPGIVIILLFQMSSSNYNEIVMKSILTIINIPILYVF